MPKKLTQEEFKAKVLESVGTRYSVKGIYDGKRKPILMHCNIHNVDFSALAECFMRGPSDVRSQCPQCSQEFKDERYKDQRVELTCAYCGKNFTRTVSDLKKSKSGLYFCCREHKDMASRLDSGNQFKVIRPDHFGTATINGTNSYRRLAFGHYPCKCAICGYEDEPKILEVHHIDENHNNNDIENLIILCPNCHRKLTNHLYHLEGRDKLVKNKEEE